MIKVSIAFFLAEFLLSMLRESDRNEEAYTYIRQSIELLEAAEKGVANFHLAFMMGLTKHLGIYPNVEAYDRRPYFDMLSSEFVKKTPPHPHYLKPSEGRYLRQLERMTYRNMHLFRLSRGDRNLIVDYILKYYRLHLYDFPRLKSLEVLREL